MALFRYEAVDKTGRVVRGAMNASDERQVAQNLAAMGYAARSIVGGSGAAAVPSSGSTGAAAPSAVSSPQPRGGMRAVTLASGLPVSVKSSVPLQSLAGFFRHIATLVKSGYTIGQALSEMESVTRDRRLRSVLPAMRESTQGGRSLSSLMAEHPRIFPVHTIASVWCGEMAGRLEIALEEIAQDLEQEASDTRHSRIGWGLMKISLATFVVLIPMANLVALLMPTLDEAMKRAGNMSREEVILNVIHTFTSQMLWKSLVVIGLMIAFWIMWGVLKRVPAVRRMLDGVLVHVPLWGRMHRERALARFLHVLDGLSAAGIGQSAAWDAASLTPRNSYVAERLRMARAQLPADAGVSQALEAAQVFDQEDVAAAASGEKAGRVPDVLATRAAAYADSATARKSIGRLVSGTLFTTSSLILGGYIMVRMISSYVDLAFKAADAMGK